MGPPAVLKPGRHVAFPFRPTEFNQQTSKQRLLKAKVWWTHETKKERQALEASQPRKPDVKRLQFACPVYAARLLWAPDAFKSAIVKTHNVIMNSDGVWQRTTKSELSVGPLHNHAMHFNG